MADNTLTNIMQKILARGLMTLREQVTMMRLVNRDYDKEAAERGDTIDIPIPTPKTAADVTPSNTPPNPAAVTPAKVSIALDKWKQSSFKMSDKDMVEVDRNEHFVPMEMSESVSALASAINLTIHEEYLGIYGYVGTAATTPFATTADDSINARKVLSEQLTPLQNRSMVLDFAAEANALGLDTYADAEKTGENGVKILGELGTKYGFGMFTDDQVLTHTAGALTGDPDVTGVNAVGVKSVDLTCDADDVIALLEGDIILFAGDTQTYVVTADLDVANSATGPVLIEPGLKVATTGNEAVTVKATHVVNLAFHRNAFALAMRPLTEATQDTALGSNIMAASDPLTGVSLRLEVSRQYKQVVWDLDALWGAKLVRPSMAVRIAG